MAKAINLRTNQAKAAVASDLPGKFAQGQAMGARQHPTASNPKNAGNTSDTGDRE